MVPTPPQEYGRVRHLLEQEYSHLSHLAWPIGVHHRESNLTRLYGICIDARRKTFSKFQSSQTVSYHVPCGRMSKFTSEAVFGLTTNASIRVPESTYYSIHKAYDVVYKLNHLSLLLSRRIFRHCPTTWRFVT